MRTRQLCRLSTPATEEKKATFFAVCWFCIGTQRAKKKEIRVSLGYLVGLKRRSDTAQCKGRYRCQRWPAGFGQVLTNATQGTRHDFGEHIHNGM